MLNCVSPHSLPYFKKFFEKIGAHMDSVDQHPVPRMYRRESKVCLQDPIKKQTKMERILKEGNVLSYKPDDSKSSGVYVSGHCLSVESNYFEIEIVDMGNSHNICIGIVPSHHPLDQQPGKVQDSIGFHAGTGRIFKGSSKGSLYASRCEVGDRMGCGIVFSTSSYHQDNVPSTVTAFFTKNGKEVGYNQIAFLPGGFFPAVSLHSAGEEVKLFLSLLWEDEEEMRMCVDSHEDDWLRLHEVHLNGLVLDYIGKGKSIIDVGLAQARHPLNITFHYFEIEILDPGENCYIAIGLARRDYPKHRHPGWNKGSIAYHADDGKLFVGSGVGEQFGPPCLKGDIMGCGILFSDDPKYNSDCSYDSDDDECDFASSDSDGDWWKGKNCFENSTAVKVFFTRNGRRLGERDVPMPKGGFYPTVGMLSSRESVRVDLHPLTG